jgi:hypothetical protein
MVGFRTASEIQKFNLPQLYWVTQSTDSSGEIQQQTILPTKNPLVEIRHFPKFSWLSFANSYVRDVTYIPCCCLAVRCLSQHTAFLTHCTAFRYWAAVGGKVRIGVPVLADSGKREVLCAILTGFIGACLVRSVSIQSKQNPKPPTATLQKLIYAHTISRTLPVL